MNGLERYLTSLWRGERTALLDRLVLSLLRLPAVCYAAAMSVRRWLYRTGIRPARRLPCPVISVGNITVGGTGKTPVTAYIARLLLDKGLRVAVLSRGYGGSLEGQCAVVSNGTELLLQPAACGDEPYLLASTVPGLAVVIGSDRYRAGLLAVEQVNPDIFLLDDGFQHLRLHRDLNILLMDARHPLGNGCNLPAGPLREPVGAHRRADLLIYTRSAAGLEPGWRADCDLATCAVGYRLAAFVRLDSGEEVSPELLAAESCVAFAGIAQPDSFFNLLQRIGIQPCATLALADHEPYTEAVVARVRSSADGVAANWLITTEKDGVKLAAASGLHGLKLVIARLELDFFDERPLLAAVEKVLLRQP